jgi:hypothetical protein
MTQKYKILIGVVALVISFAFGRYSAPISLKTETKTAQTDDKKSSETDDAKKHTHSSDTVVDITRPDGTKEHKVTHDNDTDVDNSKKETASDDKSKSTSVTKEETRSSSRLTISALAGTHMSFSSPVTIDYGAMVCKDVIGPIHVGLFGFSSGLAGIAIGLSF